MPDILSEAFLIGNVYWSIYDGIWVEIHGHLLYLRCFPSEEAIETKLGTPNLWC